MADIDLTSKPNISICINSDYPFNSVFDGNCHTLSNFTYSKNTENRVGFFGTVGSSGKIENLGLISINVTGNSSVGGLVGYNNGSINNCYTIGKISGSYVVGGLVGYHNNGTISNCSSSVIVSGRIAGGFVGHCMQGKIMQCFASGTVTGQGYYTGGFVGRNQGTSLASNFALGNVSGIDTVGGFVGISSGSTILNCYASGSVCGNNMVGGFAGDSSYGIIINCYSQGTVTGDTAIGGLVGVGGRVVNSFWDSDTSGMASSDGGRGRTTRQMKQVATFFGWNGMGEVDWTIDEGNDYPRLTWENKPGIVFGPYALSELLVGTGTETDPYSISTGEQLNWVGVFPFEWDKYFRLTADIDLSAFTGNQFNLLGAGLLFSGTLDGDGHTIYNFSYHSYDSGYTGLIASTRFDAHIQNICFMNAEVSGSEYTGTVVGRNVGSISNCCVQGVVQGIQFVGGLCGDTQYGVVSSCFTTGTVSGLGSIGGLTGYNGGILQNCYSTASVSGSNIIGGLVGGNSGTISTCYSVGIVTGDDYVGGLVGVESVGLGLANFSYWDLQASGCPTSSGGIGKTTVEMQTQATFDGWDFVGESANGTGDEWRMCSDGVDYPRLSWEFSQSGDLSCPDGVAMEDLLYLAERWMAGTPEAVGTADVNGDGRVGIEDFAVMAGEWMKGL